MGISSVAAGGVASHFGYPAAFTMAAVALTAGAVAGRYVFRPGDSPIASGKTEEFEAVPG